MFKSIGPLQIVVKKKKKETFTVDNFRSTGQNQVELCN